MCGTGNSVSYEQKTSFNVRRIKYVQYTLHLTETVRPPANYKILRWKRF